MITIFFFLSSWYDLLLSKFLWISLIKWNKKRFRLKDPGTEEKGSLIHQVKTFLVNVDSIIKLKYSFTHELRKDKYRLPFLKQILACWQWRSSLLHFAIVHGAGGVDCFPLAAIFDTKVLTPNDRWTMLLYFCLRFPQRSLCTFNICIALYVWYFLSLLDLLP